MSQQGSSYNGPTDKIMRLRVKPGLRHCFVALPSSFTHRLREDAAVSSGTVVLELQWTGLDGENCRAFVCWNGAVSGGKIRGSDAGNAEVLEMDEAFARCLGLGPMLAVYRNVQLRVQRALVVEFPRRVELKPCTPDDWELVELHAGYLEAEILRQIAVVYAGQTLPIWIHAQKLVQLRVVNVSSRAPQRLSTSTEVVVAPCLRPPPVAHAHPFPEDDAPPVFLASPPLRVQPQPARRQHWPFQAQTVIALHPSTYRAALRNPAPATDQALARISQRVRGRGNREGQREGCGSLVTGFEEVGPRGGEGGERAASDRALDDAGLHGAGNGKDAPCHGESAASLFSRGRLAALWKERSLSPLVPVPASPSSPAPSPSSPPVPCAVGLLLLSSSVLPGHVMLSQSLRRQLLLQAFDAVRLRLLTLAYDPPACPSHILLRPVQWIHAPPDALVPGRISQIPGDEPGMEEEEAFLAGGRGTGVLLPLALRPGKKLSQRRRAPPRPQQQPQDPSSEVETTRTCAIGEAGAVGQAVGAAFRAYLDTERAQTGSHGVFLADGALLLLSLPLPSPAATATGDTPAPRFLACVLSLPPTDEGRTTPVYIGLHGVPSTLRIGTVLPRAWMTEDHEEVYGLGGRGQLAANGGRGSPRWGGGGRRAGRLQGRWDEVQACLRHLAPVLDPRAAGLRVCVGIPPPGALLVHGPQESGKTTLVHAVTAHVARSPWAVGTVWVPCLALRGLKMEAVLQALAGAMAQAAAKAPALLVLDDLDALCPAENEEAGEANVQAAEIAEAIGKMLEEAREETRVREEVMRVAAGGARRLWQAGPGAQGGREGATEVGEEPGAGQTMSPVAGEGKGENRIEAGTWSKPPSEAWVILGAAAVSSAVALVATVRGPSLLHASLRRPGGVEALVEIPPLDAKAREAILAALLAQHSSNHSFPSSPSLGPSAPPSPARPSPDRPLSVVPGVDVAELAARLEGCTSLDLEVLVTRILHAAVGRSLRELGDSASASTVDPRPAVLPADVSDALEGFCAASHRNARLSSSGTSWADVGGLEEIKNEVREILEMPVKFAPLYARLPTRLPTGLLLHGPPGCGKTLLAGAVARECGLNFISIKGPEVLDKFIGASEQAVRALFARATAAAPCLLFFDEFEALAPRRGSDNTGVTDRVVNQLLTFLDGVEGRTGVYVMGATSRPDLVDSALLRPGRLDRQLYLGFPDAGESLGILKALVRKMSLTPQATAALEKVALADGADLMTGADWQAMVSTAQLEAVHEKLAAMGTTKTGNGAGGEKESSQGGDGGEGVVVTAQHLWAAFAATRPSIPPGERAKLQTIYDKFRKSRDGDYKVASATDDGKHLRTALK